MNDRGKEGARWLVMGIAAVVIFWVVFRVITRSASEGDFYFVLMRWPTLVVLFFLLALVIYRIAFWKRTWFKRQK